MAKMNCYFAGGAGCNIGKSFVKYNNSSSDGYADISTFFIDTSKSNNLDRSIPDEYFYRLEGLDGSGKKRDSNYQPINEAAREILHQFKPGDVNVIVHSCSGGSGSVLGPVLASELLSRDKLTIIITIGSTGSRIETNNTLKTLLSYETISKKRNTPVIAAYRENSIEHPRGHVDSEIQTAIILLAAIFSGQNRELDSSDLENFINYHKVTDFTPKLSLLDFFSSSISLPKGQSLVSLATLVDDNTSPEVEHPIGYQAVGYLQASARDNIKVELPVHACVIGGYFNTVVDRLTAKMETYDEARNAVTEKSITAGFNVEATDDGLVL